MYTINFKSDELGFVRDDFLKFWSSPVTVQICYFIQLLGVWTLEEKGVTPNFTTTFEDAIASPGHMSLVALEKAGMYTTKAGVCIKQSAWWPCSIHVSPQFSYAVYTFIW